MLSLSHSVYTSIEFLYNPCVAIRTITVAIRKNSSVNELGL